MDTLKLTLKKVWFDMIQGGIKTEEYREIKWYWVERFFDVNNLTRDKIDKEFIIGELKKGSISIPGYSLIPKIYYSVEFYNGAYFSKELPWFEKILYGITLDYGKPEWGAPDNERVFILKLG